MLDRRFLIWSALITVIFPIGLVGFYVLSADLDDGLEVTLDKGDVEESEPIVRSPLDYGDSYPATLLMGAIGALVTLGAVLVALFILLKRGNDNKGSSH